MLIQPHNVLAHHSYSSQTVDSPKRVDTTHAPVSQPVETQKVDTTQAPAAQAVEQSPAVRAHFGESSFEPAADKVQAKDGAPKIDPSEFGGWAGDRLQLGKLIAENLKNL